MKTARTLQNLAPNAVPRAWQRMLSGRRLDLLDPSPLDIEIEDIAHGLARVARWNGHTWVKTSVKNLLPAKQQLNGPSVTSMFAQSKSSVWAVGDGNLHARRGPFSCRCRRPLGSPKRFCGHRHHEPDS